jgi:NADPH-dependent curcumin reductase CurA
VPRQIILASQPGAFISLLPGGNTGKMIVRL